MPSLSTASLDILATSTFLGGAILLLTFALFSYMGLLPPRSRRRDSFYAGKHVVITGGSSGIGKELARVLVAAGASVTLVARNEPKLKAAVAELAPKVDAQATAPRVNSAVADCSNPLRVDEMVGEVETMFGPIDILVNAAGQAVGGYFDKMDVSLIAQQMDKNYMTQLYPTHAVFRRMCERRAGHVVFVSSMAGLTGVFGQAGYSASKFAIRGLAEALYYEAKPFGIDVTVVYPPDTETPGLAEERHTMPAETIEISETGGLFSAQKVAEEIADGVRAKRYRVTVGIIGKMLGVLTAGFAPKVSPWEVLLMPLMRAITPFFIWDSLRAVARGHLQRFPQTARQPNKNKQ
eukprot:GFKZ01010409.1.p1 GENE.GFKZ01010409.1~~GFKZ01010409.1.p1  ORF type:complete len:350 (+),score=49.49 GFKZ01010409.1:73-1122(+)